MAARFLAAVLVLFCGCRDLTVPDKQVGRVSGFIVLSNASGVPDPASGAIVTVAGTSIGAVASSQGAFSIGPITSATGALVLSLDVDHDGVDDLARSLDFAAYNIKPDRDVSVGTISLRSTATITGVVALTGRASSAGVDVFVPGYPIAARTSDTGAYLLTGVPEGTISVAASRDGFASQRIDGLDVRSGEQLSLAKLTLLPSMNEPATLRGSVQLSPSGDLLSVRVSAIQSNATTVLPASADGQFSGPVAAGRVTVVARAAGYSDAVIYNVISSPGGVTELGTIQLSQGGFSYDAGTGGGASVSVGCGDGTPGVGEQCDDGNRLAGDGCSQTCQLEEQLGGGLSCLDPTPVRLVPVTGGGLGAAVLAFNPAGVGRLPSGCSVNANTFSVRLPFRANLAIASQSHVSLRGPKCQVEELVCSLDNLTTGVLTPGDWIVGIEVFGSPAKVSLLALPVPDGPYCGDGVVDGTEACDDGNVADNDGCSRFCVLEPQLMSARCSSAPPVTLVPTGAHELGALIKAVNDDFDPLLEPSCQTAPKRTAAVRVVLPALGDLKVEATPSPVYPADFAVSVFSGSCFALNELSCTAQNQIPEGGQHTLTGLDAGTYLFDISGGSSLQYLLGRLSFHLKE